MTGNTDGGLGSVLVEKGMISQEQLDLALKLQKTTGQRLKDILIKEGFTTREQLKEFITQHVDIP